jgi:hypothetical protein
MAEVYLSEVEYEALFSCTIDATTNPTTTNYLTVENYLANILHGKLGISTALTTDPELSLAMLYVGTLIQLFSNISDLATDYVGPETFLETEQFLTKVPRFDWIVEDIRNNLDTEEAPAYWYDMGYNDLGGTEL